MVPVMPRSSQVQDLVSHSSYKACHQSGLLISLGVMVHLLTAMDLLFRACRLVKQHTLRVRLHSQLSWVRASLHAHAAALWPPTTSPSSMHASSMTCRQAASSTGAKGGRRVHGGASSRAPRADHTVMDKLRKSMCLLALLGHCLVLKSSLRRCAPSW